MALVALFSLIWSSAFVAGKIALVTLDPYTLLVIRFGLAAALMAPFCPWRRIDRRALRVGAMLGLLNNALYLGLTFSALQRLRPEIVVVVVSCAPFLTTLLAVALGQERLAPRRIVGIACGICGVAVMTGIAGAARPDPLGLALAGAGTLAFAVGTVLFRDKAVGLPVFQLNFWQTLTGGVALLPAAWLLGAPIGPVTPPVVLAVLHLALVVTIGGMALWLALIRAHGAGTAASFHLLNPVFGVALAHLAFATPLRPEDFAGAALIALGLGLAVVTRSPARVR
jgi:drug/metabolite transporter (DMT)-like permease